MVERSIAAAEEQQEVQPPIMTRYVVLARFPGWTPNLEICQSNLTARLLSQPIFAFLTFSAPRPSAVGIPP